MSQVEVTLPLDAEGQLIMLLPPELTLYLEIFKEEVVNSIVATNYNIEMPRKDLANIIHLQGQLKVINELLAVHERAMHKEE